MVLRPGMWPSGAERGPALVVLSALGDGVAGLALRRRGVRGDGALLRQYGLRRGLDPLVLPPLGPRPWRSGLRRARSTLRRSAASRRPDHSPPRGRRRDAARGVREQGELLYGRVYPPRHFGRRALPATRVARGGRRSRPRTRDGGMNWVSPSRFLPVV